MELPPFVAAPFLTRPKTGPSFSRIGNSLLVRWRTRARNVHLTGTTGPGNPHVPYGHSSFTRLSTPLCTMKGRGDAPEVPVSVFVGVACESGRPRWAAAWFDSRATRSQRKGVVMLRGCTYLLLAGTILLAAESPATAGHPFRRLRRQAWIGQTVYHGTPSAYPPATQGTYFYPDYSAIPHPWHGSRVPVPAYNWGHFGVPPRSHCVRHTGYYNDYVQWSYRSGR
jgi:hypothetical protein